MARADGLGDWLDMELGAPEIARLGAARLTEPRIAMLGTLRRDRTRHHAAIATDAATA